VEHGLPADVSSIESVYNGRLIVSGSQSSCPVSVVKLDWESVTDSDLSTLAATFDCIIATGFVPSLTYLVLVFFPLFTSLGSRCADAELS